MQLRKNSDPFKRYWWVLLVLFLIAGTWLCRPLFTTGVGERDLAVGERAIGAKDDGSLERANPAGAPGGALDLSMDGGGKYRKNLNEPVKSYLFGEDRAAETPQSPAAAPAPDAAKPAAPKEEKASFSAQLKDLAKKAKEPAARVAFNPPKAGFAGGLSGLGSSGGGTGASAGMFGSRVSNPGLTSTRGLASADGADGGGGKSATLRALRAASAGAGAAAMMAKADSAASMSGRSFDASVNTLSSVQDAPGAAAAPVSLGAAPINLKDDKPKAIDCDPSKPDSPCAKVEDLKKDKDDKDEETDEEVEEDLSTSLTKMLITMAIGGLMGGVGGAAMGQAFMQYAMTESGDSSDRAKKVDKN